MSPQTRSNAMRDLTISVIWVALCLFFLNVDRRRILGLHLASQHVGAMRWIQIPIWLALLLFWVQNGWKAWSRIRANDSEEG